MLQKYFNASLIIVSLFGLWSVMHAEYIAWNFPHKIIKYSCALFCNFKFIFFGRNCSRSKQGKHILCLFGKILFLMKKRESVHILTINLQNGDFFYLPNSDTVHSHSNKPLHRPSAIHLIRVYMTNEEHTNACPCMTY